MQAKLTISEPGDQYEQEADRVAEAVMRMPEPIGSEGVAVSGQVKDVHTQPVSSTDEEKLHRQTMDEEMAEEEEEPLQAKEVSGETPEVTPELEARLTSARGSGQPLPESVRTFFEPRFGYDFGGVRVHTDGQAVDSARSVKAHAYTLGQDIVFGSGQYAPETPAGKQLLAHELTHVVQQTGAMASTVGHRSTGPLAPGEAILDLQRSAGNRAVRQLFRKEAIDVKGAAEKIGIGGAEGPPSDEVDAFLESRRSLYQVALVGTDVYVTLPRSHEWTARYTHRALTEGAIGAAINMIYMGGATAAQVRKAYEKVVGRGVKFTPATKQKHGEGAVHMTIIDDAAMTTIAERST